MKEFVINVSDNNNWERRAQEVWGDYENEKIRFYAYDLSDCPEDAVIGRDLFDADDFIHAIQVGFDIAKQGYDAIVVNEVPWEDE